jgi:hypothetical protein
VAEAAAAVPAAAADARTRITEGPVFVGARLTAAMNDSVRGGSRPLVLIGHVFRCRAPPYAGKASLRQQVRLITVMRALLSRVLSRERVLCVPPDLMADLTGQGRSSFP